MGRRIDGLGRPQADRRGRLALALWLGLCLVLTLLLPTGPVRAQDQTQSYSSFVTPFPANGIYRLLVIGDSLADGTYAGLANAFRDDKTIELSNQSAYATGFSRRIYIGRNKEFAPLLDANKPDIVVVTVGATDAVSPIMDGMEKQRFGTPRWRELYSQRIDEFLARLKSQRIAVYWVGLPIMEDPSVNENMNTLNDLFREKAHRSGAKFIDTWNGFVDQYGNYSPFGPDLTGQNVRLRAKDGIRFTADGYDKLANYVERELRRDLVAARSERNVPLAGDLDEQKDIAQKPLAAQAEGFVGMSGENSDPSYKVAQRSTTSAAVFGELIASDRASGLTLLSSVTRINDPALSGSQHTLPLNLRPYYRVLVKGEALPAKHGRADDFTVQAAASSTAPAVPAPTPQ